METRVCESCKRLFYYVSGPTICTKCREAEEDKFKKVKDYLKLNPGATVAEVSEETKVSTKLILSFLRDERLEVRSDSLVLLACECCGKKILTGARCAECESKMLKESNHMKGSFVQKDSGQAGAKMRFLNADQYKKRY